MLKKLEIFSFVRSTLGLSFILAVGLILGFLWAPHFIGAQGQAESTAPGTPPTLSAVQATLEVVTQARTGLPALPRNSIRYFQGTYRWYLGTTDLEVRVYITGPRDENTVFLQASSDQWEVCPPREVRGALSTDTILLMYQITPEGRWVIFQFPDQDLPVCGFVDAFLTLYRFFLRAIPDQDTPQFPAVVGTLP